MKKVNTNPPPNLPPEVLMVWRESKKRLEDDLRSSKKYPETLKIPVGDKMLTPQQLLREITEETDIGRTQIIYHVLVMGKLKERKRKNS